MQLLAHTTKHILPLVALLIFLLDGSLVQAEVEDDPLLTKILINEFEIRNAHANSSLALDSQGWIGKDLQKLWYKAELTRVAGQTEEAELQALYSQAVLPFWDIQAGLRQDLSSTSSRRWAVIGLRGLAPYFFEIDTALFIGESGQMALRFEAEYELFLTQRLIIVPDIEVNVYGQNDAAIGVGLSDIELGLRLRYEIRRELAPYIGVNWSRQFGKSANFARNNGTDTRQLEWVIGVRAWL